MNKQGKGKIDWTDYTINPVKGKCPNVCWYCYARQMYDRFKWNPKIRFEPKVLEEIKKIKKPSKIFIGSTHELFGCYDNQTEVLTKSGWKYFKDVSYENELAYLNLSTNRLEYAHPLSITKIPYRGKLYKVKAKSIDLVVTPNHKMYVSQPPTTIQDRQIKKKNWTFKMINAKDIFHKTVCYKRDFNWEGKKTDYFELPAVVNEKILLSNILKSEVKKRNKLVPCKCGCGKQFPKYDNRGRERHYLWGHHKGKNYPSFKIAIKDWMEFFGYWISEGSTQQNKNHYRVKIFQKKGSKYYPRMVESVRIVGRQMGAKATVNKDGSMIINSKPLCLYLSQFGHSNEKYIPNKIKSLAPFLLKILLDALVCGDGYEHKNLKSDGFSYYTVSKKLADDVQEIALKCGYVASISEREPRTYYNKKTKRVCSGNFVQYQVIIGSVSRMPEVNYHRTVKRSPMVVEKWIDYDGMVYCAEVPSHILYVRRNGKSCWCGNSWIPDNWIEKIIQVARDNPQHTFQFLTKNPKRYLEFEFPEHCWLGTTLTGEHSQGFIESCRLVNLSHAEGEYKFVSIEPLLGNFKEWGNNDKFLEFDLVIVGAMSGPNAIVPKKEWIQSIKHRNIFYKENIKKYLPKKVAIK